MKTEMKKRTDLKFLAKALTLALAILIAFASCGRTVPPSGPDTTAGASTTAAPDPSFEISKDFVIVRPDTDNDEEIEALKLLNRCVKSAYGYSLPCTTDFVKPGTEIKPAEHEILIGGTNRPESQSVAEGLEGRDGVWRVLDNNVIVIAGGSPAATLEATRAFCKEVFGYEEAPDESGTVLSAGRPAKIAPGQSGEISVAFPQHLLNGTDLCEYVIVTENTGSAVTKFANAILEACGHLPDVIAPADYSDGPALFLGYTPWAEGHVDEPFDAYSYYAVVSDVSKVAVDWKSPASASAVLADFIKVIIPGEESTSVSFRNETTRLFTVTGEYNLLSLASVASQELAPGIVYTKVLYKDGNGNPVRVYAVAMDKGAGRFYAGLPDDSPTEVSGRVQNVMNQIKAAVANGRKVVAGFNSGFFDMGGTGLSRGLVIKEGVVAAANTERPFFAQLKSGELLILPAGSYTTYKDSINTALAGNIILLKNGLINSISQGTDMATTRHPRTTVGFNSEKGQAVVIEVDGRQPSVSNGASYLDLISIFRDFGCTDMINLDGGGSSTAIIRKADGTYELQNSPSDKSMRSVQDSIFIILND